MRSMGLVIVLHMVLGLAACGAESPEVPTVKTEETAAILDYCQMDTGKRTATSDQAGYLYTPLSWWRSAGSSDETSSVYAWGRTEDENYRMSLSGRFADHRGSDVGIYVSSGVAEQRFRMGVVIPDVFDDQAAACVKSVSQFRQVGSWTYSPETPAPLVKLVWDSYYAAPIAISDLPAIAIDGFEFVANFAPADGQVYFKVRKSFVADAASTQICRLEKGTGGWACETPSVSALGEEGWLIELARPVPGVYMLVSPNPNRGG